MADLSGFDARTVEPTADFEPIPAGKYIAAITASQMKPTKNGNGSYLGGLLVLVDEGLLFGCWVNGKGSAAVSCSDEQLVLLSSHAEEDGGLAEYIGYITIFGYPVNVTGFGQFW